MTLMNFFSNRHSPFNVSTALFASLLVSSALICNTASADTSEDESANSTTSETTLPPLKVVGDKVNSEATSETYQPVLSSYLMKSDTQIIDIPQAINIVPEEVLNDLLPKNLDDALANVSGITQGNTLASTQDTVMKRGFGGNRDGSILRNGAPIIQGRSFNDTAQSVEVLKGPASLLYGIMDPGGVINIVSKKPQMESANILSAGLSTYGSGKNGSSLGLDSTGQIGQSNVAYRLILDAVDEDYWRNFGKRKEQLIAPSIRWFGENTEVLISYEYRDFLYPSDRGTVIDPTTNKPLNIPATRRLDEPVNTMEGHSQLFQTSVDHYLNDDWKLHAAYSYNEEKYNANQLRVTAIDTTTGTLTRKNSGTHDAVSTDSFSTVYLNGHFDMAGMANDIMVGVDHESREYFRENMVRDAIAGSFNYLDPTYGTVGESTTVDDSASDQTDKLKNTSVFFQDTLHLTDKWLLTTGARFLSYDQVAGKGRPFNTNTDLSGHKLLPRLGVVYKVTPEVSLYSSYTQSLKPTSTIAAKSGIVVDSSITPEESTSYEIGTKVQLKNGITGTLAVFDIHKENVLVSEYNDATSESEWRTSGKARSRGIELDVSGQVTEKLQLIASYAYIDAITTEDPDYEGNRLVNVAKNTASLSSNYQVNDAVSVGGGFHYVDDRAGDSANSFTLPSYTIADVFATYKTTFQGKDLTWQLNVKNLFDKVYYTSSTNKYFVSMGDSRQMLLTAKLAL
ncbi:TonB-dependent siderophore receptor [Marinomonas profundimaris]|uniref:TonB-dependent receptor n=1 Tax=Marinomonas profundimaris TaxID=1208321 RepID=W1RYT4_9GAMM|nr:TonB-dependent siderophore receptor [Marinomonas profundimaris]ETI62351.1 TonB-dependent receptor [Marinomonas profundimaris]